VVGDNDGLGGLEGDNALFALKLLSVSVCYVVDCVWYGTFFALSESSLASMVMYFTPLTLTPSEMTFLGSDLSPKDLAMAALSSAESCTPSASMHRICATRASHPGRLQHLARVKRTTYREVGGCGPGSCALDVADEGLVDVAGADEAR
jgi:hypothetical protein